MHRLEMYVVEEKERSVVTSVTYGQIESPLATAYSNYTVSQKKGPTCKLSVTLSNLNRFSKFLHYWKAYKIRYKSYTKLPTSP